LNSGWIVKGDLGGFEHSTRKVPRVQPILSALIERKRLFDRTAIGDLTSFVAAQRRYQAASLSAER